MIKNLKSDNDKMNMIPIIKLIDERIKLFFSNLKFKKKISLNDEEIINNTLNIDGSWGSGKSTIIHNLEKYYKYKKLKPQFIIINLWEYETSINPYLDLVEDIFYKICPDLEEISKNQNSKIKQLFLKFKSKLVLPNKFSYSFTEPQSGITHTFSAESVKSEQSKSLTLNTNIENFIVELIKKINENQEKIVVIFDELDRCTPNNQIIFLSYIKNIFFIVASNNEIINLNISRLSNLNKRIIIWKIH